MHLFKLKGPFICAIYVQYIRIYVAFAPKATRAVCAVDCCSSQERELLYR